MTAAPDAATPSAAEAVDDRDWPHTSRALPWLAVTVLAMLFLVPIDSIELPIPLPVDARPDRILLGAFFVCWLLVVATRAPGATRHRYRFGPFEVALFGFVAACVASAAVNVTDLGIANESELVLKKLVLILGYAGFYVFLVGTLRASEIPAVIRLVVCLGFLTALGTLAEYVLNYNVFYAVSSALSPPGTSVASANIVTSGGRADITGPARHGLAVCTLLAMVLPLAVVGAVFADGRRDRWLYRLAALIIFIGCVSTIRRSGVVLPFVSCSAVVLLGGRRMLPVLGAFAVLLVVTPIVAPGIVADLKTQFSASNTSTQNSIQGRTQDYPAVVPDLRSGALLGRGFGSYDARRYRYLDNQFLGSMIETGVVGTGAYLAMILVGAGMALRTGLRRVGTSSWIALGGFGSILAYLVSNALFDTLAFPHAPYGFLMIVALIAVGRQADERRPAKNSRSVESGRSSVQAPSTVRPPEV